ncbi:ferredoxin [Phytohabitans houttuyneae]|uniref:Ferredoxin n=1 Tax=Phytohabitans houttuyneae TaxID=1076126 RepID=A0A6V8KU25_9ACTN|nr:ferredoxin [Phytohabitans houttuyneae]GFJ85366.1 ferredoxin [Phytohabitans houttuyneae]
MRVVANPRGCIGAGQCVITAPNVFDQDEDGIVVVIEERPGDADLADVRDALDLCPSQSLALTN